ncbi:MAG: DMT family transporter [Candidatus Nanopelagicaceae bacterium]|jgi:drug/metabolite transporter (DMT)-like permease|nr:DMT family transporter [Candidatus Nanopelagicaceae bacterium]
MKHKLASWLLLGVAMSWGLAFVTMKDALGRQSVNSFLFYRFALAAIALIIIRPQIIKNINKDIVKRGGITGLFLAAGFIFQTYGLDMTGAAVTGFITGLYVVATPLFEQFFGGRKLGRTVWVSIGIATTGLGLLSLKGFSVGIGELLVLISALCYTGQIIALSKWSQGRDVWAMTFMQILVVAIVTGIAALIEGFQTPPDSGVWGVIIFTAIVCTVTAFIIQTWSQAILESTKAAVIMTMEVVFSALFAITLGGEILSTRTLIGGLLVVISMYTIVFHEGAKS